MATGILGLDGNVSRVAGSRTKARLAARVAGSKVLMLPRPNMTEAQQVVEEQHLKLQLRPLQTMCDAIKGAVRKPKLRASLSDVLREGASATALRRNIVSLKAVSTVGHNVYSVIVAAIPGSGQVRLTQHSFTAKLFLHTAVRHTAMNAQIIYIKSPLRVLCLFNKDSAHMVSGLR